MRRKVYVTESELQDDEFVVLVRYELCGKCDHRRDAHAVTQDGYHCVRCKCKRRFWR